MKKIELIICFDNGSWDSGFIVEIPENIYQTKDVDTIADYVLNNLDWFEKSEADITYIGVLNWSPDYD